MKAEVAAFILALVAGAATCIGGVLALVLQNSIKPTPFAGTLAFAAGVMIFVSFVDIYFQGLNHIRDAVQTRWPNHPHQEGIAQGIGMALFFCGWILATVLNSCSHLVMHWQDRRAAKEGKLPPKKMYESTDAAATENSTSSSPSETSVIESQETRGRQRSTRRDCLTSIEVTHSHTSQTAEVKEREGWRGSFGRFWNRIWESEIVRALAGTEPQDEEIRRFVEAKFLEDKAKISRLGYCTALVLAIHNFPEGIATFTGGLADMKLGIGIAVAIGIHNIPEGLAISVPILISTGSKFKAIFWASVSGFVEPVGGLVAWGVMGGIPDPFTFGVLFFVVAGIMVNVSIKELLISALRYDPANVATTPCLLAGMLVMAVSICAMQFSG